MITKRKCISFLVSCYTGIGKNDFSDIIGNNADHSNSSAAENKVEKSDNFLGLNIDSPFDVYGFRS